MLEHLVVHKMNAKGKRLPYWACFHISPLLTQTIVGETLLKEGELDSILRFGTAELFTDSDTNRITYDDDAISALLDRDRHEEQPDSSQHDEYLQSFKV